MSKVLVVGGGPSGMIAAIYAAKDGHDVTLYEKNEKLGKKLYITGKGRCNITNACEIEDLFRYVVTNHKFLYSSFYSFSNQDVMSFFEEIGLPLKVERGNRVFPFSDKSSDVISALLSELKRQKVKIEFGCEVTDIVIKDGKFAGVYIRNEKKLIKGDRIIIGTGGLSYRSTGSTGDGYKFAKQMGHTITDLYPSLVPFNIKESFIKELQGLSLRNIQIDIFSQGKKICSEFGELLFTHFGVSGPVILSGSSYVVPYMKNKDILLEIDLKPALTFEQLDQRVIRDFQEMNHKQFRNSLDHLLPKKLIPVMIQLSEIDLEKKVHEITKQERQRLVSLMKRFALHVSSLREYNEAVITKGGISVKEIHPITMESKLVSGVHFVGEVLDLDALTGGFNLQIGWSTGHSAGISMNE